VPSVEGGVVSKEMINHPVSFTATPPREGNIFIYSKIGFTSIEGNLPL
jgi:hypothetical protein